MTVDDDPCFALSPLRAEKPAGKTGWRCSVVSALATGAVVREARRFLVLLVVRSLLRFLALQRGLVPISLLPQCRDLLLERAFFGRQRFAARLLMVKLPLLGDGCLDLGVAIIDGAR